MTKRDCTAVQADDTPVTVESLLGKPALSRGATETRDLDAPTRRVQSHGAILCTLEAPTLTPRHRNTTHPDSTAPTLGTRALISRHPRIRLPGPQQLVTTTPTPNPDPTRPGDQRTSHPDQHSCVLCPSLNRHPPNTHPPHSGCLDARATPTHTRTGAIPSPTHNKIWDWGRQEGLPMWGPSPPPSPDAQIDR